MKDGSPELKIQLGKAARFIEFSSSSNSITAYERITPRLNGKYYIDYTIRDSHFKILLIVNCRSSLEIVKANQPKMNEKGLIKIAFNSTLELPPSYSGYFKAPHHTPQSRFLREEIQTFYAKYCESWLNSSFWTSDDI